MDTHAIYGDSPFTPMVAKAPPFLAGRGKETGIWASHLATMRGETAKGRPEGNIVLMYGPRGMGKTALLDAFADMAVESGIDVVRKESEDFSVGSKELAQDLLESLIEPDWQKDSMSVSGEVSAWVAKGGGEETQRFVDPGASGSLKFRLEGQCRKNPLAVLVDEAHAIKGEQPLLTLNALINVAQELAKRLPFTLVLAGTPGLLQTLEKANCSFLVRQTDESVALGIGRLDDEAARAAILEPLKQRWWRPADETRLAIEPAALDHAVADSQNYPFFLQIWGHELWKHSVQQESPLIRLEDALRVEPSILDLRDEFYVKYGQELTGSALLLTAANAVAGLFPEDEDAPRPQPPAAQQAIDRALREQLPDMEARWAKSEELLNELQRLGFCWKAPRIPGLMPGIPSFLNHAQQLYKGFAEPETGTGR